MPSSWNDGNGISPNQPYTLFNYTVPWWRTSKYLQWKKPPGDSGLVPNIDQVDLHHFPIFHAILKLWQIKDCSQIILLNCTISNAFSSIAIQSKTFPHKQPVAALSTECIVPIHIYWYENKMKTANLNTTCSCSTLTWYCNKIICFNVQHKL